MKTRIQKMNSKQQSTDMPEHALARGGYSRSKTRLYSANDVNYLYFSLVCMVIEIALSFVFGVVPREDLIRRFLCTNFRWKSGASLPTKPLRGPSALKKLSNLRTPRGSFNIRGFKFPEFKRHLDNTFTMASIVNRAAIVVQTGLVRSRSKLTSRKLSLPHGEPIMVYARL